MIKAVKEAKLHSSWINPERAHTKTPSPLRRARARRARGGEFLPAFRRSRSASRAAGSSTRCRRRAEDRVARRAGLLPGLGAVGLESRRPRQPAAGGLRSCAQQALDRDRSPPRAARGGAGARTIGVAARSTGETARSSCCVTAAGLRLRAARAGRVPRRRVPAAGGRDHGRGARRRVRAAVRQTAERRSRSRRTWCRALCRPSIPFPLGDIWRTSRVDCRRRSPHSPIATSSPATSSAR